LRNYLRDLGFGWRMLRRSPGFAFAAIFALAVGIGANTAIFSLVEAVVLRPLPYPDPGRIVMVWAFTAKKGDDTVEPAELAGWRREARSFASLAAFFGHSFTLTGGEAPEKIDGASVTSNLFSVLGVRPEAGRLFRISDPSEEARSVLLSDRLWRRRFAADLGVVGRQLDLDGQSYTVLGVLPDSYRFPETAELWVRAPHAGPALNIASLEILAKDLSSSYLRVVGKLRPGVSLRQARSDMSLVAQHMAELYPSTSGGRGVHLVTLHDQIAGNVQPILMVLLCAVACVLLIACVNVANLLLARSSVREREMAVRAALGASRGRLLGQLLSESMLLALLSGVAGVALGSWVLPLLVKLGGDLIPAQAAGIGLDRTVLLFSLGVSLLTGLLFGLIPAFQGSASGAGSLARRSARTSGGRATVRGRSALMAAEVAFALVLLVGAGLMIRTMTKLQHVPAGFTPDGILAFKIGLSTQRYSDRPKQAEFFRQAIEGIRSLPGVESAGAVLTLPMGGDSISLPVRIQGKPLPPPRERQRDGFQVVTPGYFATLRIPLLRGRQLAAGDSTGAPLVAVISAEMARRYWPDQDPLGQRITYDDTDTPPALVKWLTIVGVVGNVHHDGLAGASRAEVYRPQAQDPWSFLSVVVRAAPSVNPLSLVPAVRAEIAHIDANQPISEVATMTDRMNRSVSNQHLASNLLAVFAGIALLLALSGIYGVISYAVARRQHEIGIRIALGARPWSLVGGVLSQGAAIASIGVAIGLAGAFLLTRLLDRFLFGVTPTDPTTFIGVPVLLLAVALLASAIPAYRASRVPPAIAFRAE
jgi:putative ABC transport system permease protein